VHLPEALIARLDAVVQAELRSRNNAAQKLLDESLRGREAQDDEKESQ
jgi:metal-responsive CopG/Arc/MetJ family transcriptional regulator